MATELVGGALVSAFVQMTIDSLASRFVDYFRGRKLNKMLLTKLKVKLLSVDALADDAEHKQFRDPRVRHWLLMAKDVVCEAEDLLDEINYEISKCEVEAESQTTANKVSNFVKSFSPSSFEKEIESRMEQVLEDLEDLAGQSGCLGLNRASGVGVGSGSGSILSQKLPSTSLVVESVICGRDDEKEMIINWLTSDTDNRNQPSILSIVGMGGVGKTTLAQHVYNEPRIEGKFDIKAWVCVSDDFDVFKLTRTILEAITKSTDDSRNLEMVHERLKQNLTGKRFLLVADDIWNIKQKEWEALQTPLNYGKQGSKIVVTTRDLKVASSVGSNKTHPLRQLQGDHCWQLFAKHAFQDDNPQSNPDFKAIGMMIVEKCKGLPLALKTIGSLLHKKSSVLEWERVLKSEIWEFPEEDSDIVPALRLSYHHLPSPLKRCFAYCSLFPKDYEFNKMCLIQLWMAEIFLQCRQPSKSPEEVGEQYFNDLLSRSFFQQSSNRQGIMCFVMHDLLNDLAKYVCGDICFRLEVDQAKSIPKTTRHFSFAADRVHYFEGFGSLYGAERLRTFMPTGWGAYDLCVWHYKMSIPQLFSEFKFFRVLSLSYCSGLTEVPDSVGDLKHLRSLDLSHTGIKELPDSTCSLYHLQILKLSNCIYLEELPANLHKLTNLHWLEFMNTKVRKVPAHLGKLKNLQVLMSSFNVGKSTESSIQQLRELNLHRSLSIGDLQNIENPLDALAADLKNKARLVQLELNWDKDRKPDDSTKERDLHVIENLQPSKHLEKLSVSNYGGKQFPRWLFNNSLSNVVSLTLGNCQSCQHLPPLGLLPFLKDLHIRGLDGIVDIGADFYGSSSSSFTSLETLEFSCMKEWEKWDCQAVTGAFPRLQYLSIERCPKLKGHLPEQLRLKKLEIIDCKQLEASAPSALELQLEDCGKLQFDWATLKRLSIGGHSMEASLLKMIEPNISDNSLEFLDLYSFPQFSCCRNCQISDGCDSLKTFPLDFFPTIRSLILSEFRNLQMISQGQAHNHLECLSISACPQLESLPERMHILLPSLDELRIYNCPKVESFPEGGLPAKLKEMYLGNSSKLIASMKGTLGDHPSLETLDIQNSDAECFPDEGLLPLSLTSLQICDFPNLKTLDYKGLCHLSSLEKLCLRNCPRLQCLPEGLCHLSTLKTLDVSNCPSLQCLPEEGLPKSISYLRIWGNCPLLRQRCRQTEGEDWPKIAHIEKLSIS